MQQTEIDFSKRSRLSDPETSHEAGRSAEEFAAKHHARILGSLLTQGEATIHELATRLGMDVHQVGRRMLELQRLGVARRTGVSHLGPNGRQCRVWIAV